LNRWSSKAGSASRAVKSNWVRFDFWSTSCENLSIRFDFDSISIRSKNDSIQSCLKSHLKNFNQQEIDQVSQQLSTRMAEISENLFCDVLPWVYHLLLSNFGIFRQ
jgi:hypothetical protein